MFFEITGVVNTVKSISRKTGDLFCNDQVEFATVGARDHAVKFLPSLRIRAGDAFICKYFVKLPIGIAFNILLKKSSLAFKRIRLVFIVDTRQ